MQEEKSVGDRRAEHAEVARRALIVGGVGVALFLLVALVWFRPEVLLVVFASYLFAVAVRFVAGPISRRSHLSEKTSVFLIVVTLLVLTGVGLYLLGKPLGKQITQFAHEGPKAIEPFVASVRAHPWGQKLLGSGDPAQRVSQSAESFLKLAPGVAGRVLDVVATVVVWFFIGFYGALDPDVYERGFLHLFPKKKRARMGRVLRDASANVGRWLVARFVAMVACFVLTLIGLWLLKIPMALVLALIAGLFAFVDYVGAVASAVPAVLVALAKSPTHALGVIVVFIVVHVVEGYVLTPILVRRAVHAPPAFTLGMQLLLGSIFGIAGIVLANPMTVVILVTVQRLYVEDALDDQNVGPLTDG